MSRSPDELFSAFDRGIITRRQLLAALAVAFATPAIAAAQGAAGCDSGAGAARGAGGGGGRGRGAAGDSTGRAGAAGRGGGGGRGQAQRDTTPLTLPFAATGWKTVWLDHLDYICTDYAKAAAFYSTLMNWKVRSDDGKQAVLDIGENSGGMILRNGLVAPPPAAITDAGLGVTRPQITAIYDGFAWGIDQWDTKKVGDELTRRGLNPEYVKRAGGYEGYVVKDPDGFRVTVTNGTKANRRRGPANGKLSVKAPFEPTGWNTLYLDHISFEVPDYRRSAAFYQALLGWEGRPGGGGQTTVRIGENGSVGGAIIRGNAAARTATAARGRGDSAAAVAAVAPKAGTVSAAIGHISWGIANWDTERVRAELKQRGVTYIDRCGMHEPRPDMTGQLFSYHVPDAHGWDLQIGNKIGDTTYNGK